MWPKAFDDRLLMTGSSTISSVPKTVNRISGRKRSASCGLKPKLAGTGDLRAGRRCGRLYPEGNVHVGLIQNSCGALAYLRQERLRVHAHPHHHHDEREDGGPFAQVEVGHVVL